MILAAYRTQAVSLSLRAVEIRQSGGDSRHVGISDVVVHVICIGGRL